MTDKPDFRMSDKQKIILEFVDFSNEELAGYFMRENGSPFDFSRIYYGITGRTASTSYYAAGARTTLRRMVAKGALVRIHAVRSVPIRLLRNDQDRGDVAPARTP
jgi:hypothetical protein